MMQKKYIIFFPLIMLLLSSCYSYRHVGLLQEHNKRLPVYKALDYEEYRIKINDELLFRLITSDETISRLITSNQTLSSAQSNVSYRVYPDGTVDFPFVKNIPVAGLTLNEAAIVVENRFKELIPDAAVKLTLANKNFTVIGEAGTGVYPIFKDKLTLFQALSMSGEISYTGDYKNVRIIRETVNGTEVLEFDIRPLSIINSKYYYIYPNDIIYVQKNPASFYKVNNYSSFISLISSSLSLLFMVIFYFK
ncbi:MAG: polysaccharide biosynthesis/export family protein [Paludibacter sp.]|nr:polysaccharide biosynthesis/export family protein [Paludibacter sp.]MDD4426895.1 polysaccharide biosynthesis/export family protein [Paludibacter sp.]